MSDRALLEAAAKAAGLAYVFGEVYKLGDSTVDCSDMLYVTSKDTDESPVYWNPLEDDGDALRLAVNRRFTIKDFAPHDAPEIVQIPPDGAMWGMVEIWREDDTDPLHVEWYRAGADRYAATRRAIVRAAAIGVKVSA